MCAQAAGNCDFATWEEFNADTAARAAAAATAGAVGVVVTLAMPGQLPHQVPGKAVTSPMPATLYIEPTRCSRGMLYCGLQR